MKNVLFVLCLYLSTVVSATAVNVPSFESSNLDFKDSEQVVKSTMESSTSTLPIENSEIKNYEVEFDLDLDDDALECSVTITVTMGPVKVSGSVSGDCDEIKAAAIKLLKELIDEAEGLLD